MIGHILDFLLDFISTATWLKWDKKENERIRREERAKGKQPDKLAETLEQIPPIY